MLAQLAEDFGLQVQTGGIACNYFDRYIPIALRKGPMSKRQMQMIASTCMLISAKFFDRKLPPISELVILHNHTVTPEQFMHQEMVILEALEWKLHVILPHALIEPLRACLPDAPADQAINDRMMFFIDLSVYGTRRTVGARAPRPAGAAGRWRRSAKCRHQWGPRGGAGERGSWGNIGRFRRRGWRRVLRRVSRGRLGR